MNKSLSVNNTPLNPNDIAIPCGAYAKSYFNDQFSLHNSSHQIVINSKNISITKNQFKNNNLSKQWIDLENNGLL